VNYEVKELKRKNTNTNFISTDSIVFLVECNKNIALKRTPMILNIKDDLKTFREVMSFRMVFFWKKNDKK